MQIPPTDSFFSIRVVVLGVLLLRVISRSLAVCNGDLVCFLSWRVPIFFAVSPRRKIRKTNKSLSMSCLIGHTDKQATDIHGHMCQKYGRHGSLDTLGVLEVTQVTGTHLLVLHTPTSRRMKSEMGGRSGGDFILSVCVCCNLSSSRLALGLLDCKGRSTSYSRCGRRMAIHT